MAARRRYFSAAPAGIDTTAARGFPATHVFGRRGICRRLVRLARPLVHSARASPRGHPSGSRPVVGLWIRSLPTARTALLTSRALLFAIAGTLLVGCSGSDSGSASGDA